IEGTSAHIKIQQVAMIDKNSYAFLVQLKYQIYNSIFLTLDFETIRQTGIQLPMFQDHVHAGLEMGHTPKQIITEYFSSRGISEGDMHTALFRFIQYVERQV